MTPEMRKAKLAKLVESEGFDSLDDLIAATISDSVSPAICMQSEWGCDYTDRRWSRISRGGYLVTRLTGGQRGNAGSPRRVRTARGAHLMSAAATFKEVGEARYDEMLGVLPPALWIDKGFLVGEPFDHRRCKATGRLTASLQLSFATVENTTRARRR